MSNQPNLSNQHHLPVALGWNSADNNGWVLECSCGAWFGPNLFMSGIGEDFDDHMRKEGILVEE